VCVTLALLAAGAARADNASVQQRAHQSFLDGQQAFNAGRYEEALQAFQASFALSARPELLLPLAQTTRKLGRYEEAITYCERYLAGDVPPANARAARDFLQQLRAESAAAHAPAVPPSPPPSAPAPTVSPTTPPLAVAPAPVAPAPVAVTASAPAPASRRRALAIGLGVAGGVVVAAVAITLGVVLSTPSNRYPSSPLGTVPFDH
jgi:tetratricopeptide (TPR) repeat protein